MSTFQNKLNISIGSGLLFALVNYTNIFNNNCHNDINIMFKFIMFFIITYLSMYKSNINNLIKLKHTIYGSLIFFFLSNPTTHRLLLLNNCNSIYNIVILSSMYSIVLFSIMYLP